MAMVQLDPDDETRTAEAPRSTADLRLWVRQHLNLDEKRALQLFQAVEHVVGRQRQLLEESKHDAIRALSEGFAAKMERLQRHRLQSEVR
jgi:predicted thioredoxin/glutaredoxin